MIADFRRLLEEEGDFHQVDGVDLLCIIHPVELLPGEFEQLLVERQKLSYLAGDLIARVVGQIVAVDGARWKIISVRPAGVSITWTMERGVA